MVLGEGHELYRSGVIEAVTGQRGAGHRWKHGWSPEREIDSNWPSKQDNPVSGNALIKRQHMFPVHARRDGELLGGGVPWADTAFVPLLGVVVGYDVTSGHPI
jgi:hypothetical protein